MAIFAISFIVVALAMLGMAIGVLFGRPCIRGTCGGLNDQTRSTLGYRFRCYGCSKNTDGRD